MYQHRIKAALLVAIGVSVAGTALQAQAPDSAQGRITVREYDVSGPNTIARLTDYAGYPDSPDRTSYPNIFEWPAGPDGMTEDVDDPDSPPPGNVRDQYAWEIRGYIHPEETATYYFAIAADDPGELWLSTDSDFANLELIATEPNWNPIRSFASEARRTFDEDRGSLENHSEGIRLQAGQAYAVMARAVEGGGGDNLAVAWNTDGPEFFEDGQAPITGEVLSTFDRSEFGQPFFRSLGGGPTGFTAVLNDGEGAGAVEVDPSTVSATLDGADAPVEVSKDGARTSLTHTIDGAFFEAGSDHTVVVSFNGQEITKSFTVGNFATVPASAALGDYSSSNRGFIMRVLQANTGLANNNDLREQHLAGTLTDGNGDPLENFADDFFFNSDGLVEVEGVINFDQDGNPQGVFRDSGDGSVTDVFDDFIPGIPGIDGSTDNITAEILTVIEIPEAGLYNFAFNSDDGFKTTAGAVGDAAEAILLGEFNGGRGANTTFYNVVFEEAGFYKLRSIWYEGGGGANLEWWLADLDGNPLGLLNDGDGGLRTFRDIPEDPAAVNAFSPGDGAGEIATSGAQISVTVTNGSTSVDTGSVAATLNGEALSPNASESDGVVTITADLPDLDGNTLYNWEVTFDAGGVTRVVAASFRTTVLAGDGLVFIESEDFNFGQGDWDKSNPIGTTGAYPGGTYQDLGDGIDETEVDSGTDYGVDYFESNNGNAQAVYRPDTGVEAGKTNGPAGLFRGAFDVETNHVVGWNDGGDWSNYTRDIPEGTYSIFGAISSGGAAIDTTFSVVTGDAGAPNQDTEVIGQWTPGRATAGWDNFEIFPLLDADGNAVIRAFSGVTTFRYTTAGGNNDHDFFVLVPTAIPDPVLPPVPGGGGGTGGNVESIANNGDGTVTIVFTGTLSGSETVDGTYLPIPGASSPFTTDAAAGTQFYTAQ